MAVSLPTVLRCTRNRRRPAVDIDPHVPIRNERLLSRGLAKIPRRAFPGPDSAKIGLPERARINAIGSVDTFPPHPFCPGVGKCHRSLSQARTGRLRPRLCENSYLVFKGGKWASFKTLEIIDSVVGKNCFVKDRSASGKYFFLMRGLLRFHTVWAKCCRSRLHFNFVRIGHKTVKNSLICCP